jgi:hypothetical protein
VEVEENDCGSNASVAIRHSPRVGAQPLAFNAAADLVERKEAAGLGEEEFAGDAARAGDMSAARPSTTGSVKLVRIAGVEKLKVGAAELGEQSAGCHA